MSSFSVLDLERLPLGILSGIGFIGAGVIVKRDNNLVTGVTTAATIWFVSVLGLLFGGGQLVLGCAATALAIFILWGLRHAENYIPHERQGHLASSSTPAPLLKTTSERSSSKRVASSRAGKQRMIRPESLTALECTIRWRERPSHEPHTPAAVEQLRTLPGIRSLTWSESTCRRSAPRRCRLSSFSLREHLEPRRRKRRGVVLANPRHDLFANQASQIEALDPVRRTDQAAQLNGAIGQVRHLQIADLAVPKIRTLHDILKFRANLFHRELIIHIEKGPGNHLGAFPRPVRERIFDELAQRNDQPPEIPYLHHDVRGRNLLDPPHSPCTTTTSSMRIGSVKAI